MDELLNLKGKRIASLDYGRKRVGFAVCDELHIVVSPREVFDFTSESFWEKLLNSLRSEKVEAIVVGVPYRLDEAITEIISEINSFIDDLKNKSGLPVIPFDESYSSVTALHTMISNGTGRKKRSEKGSKDKIAAAVILRDFLNENNL